jgi:hypothetical protein
LRFFKNALNDRLVTDGLKIKKHGSHHLYAAGPRFVGSSKILLFYKFQPVVELSKDDKSGNYQNTLFSFSSHLLFSFPFLFFHLHSFPFPSTVIAHNNSTVNHYCCITQNIKLMASSLSAHSIVIHFSLTKGNEEQQQPFATTPKHIYRSSLIQAPELKFTTG